MKGESVESITLRILQTTVLTIGSLCFPTILMSQRPSQSQDTEFTTSGQTGNMRPAEQSRRGRGQFERRRGGRGGGGDDGRGRDRSNASKSGPEHVAQTQVPAHHVDIVLGRPTVDSITISILAYVEMSGQVFYGTERGQLSNSLSPTQFANTKPTEFVLRSLLPNTRYFYELRYQVADDAHIFEGTFHTQRPAGTSFVFTVQADSHLDQNTSPAVYTNTLKNVLADEPDFHIDLGDTFMTGKYRGDAPSELYLAQRYYFGLACRSAPLFLVLGNHDGEPGGRGRSRTEAISLRQRFFPNPFPDAFYAGNSIEEDGIGPLENYYAWHWGDALFVVLDPYWHSGRKRGGQQDNWSRTLGQQQYKWLKATLESSPARLKFVFIHHLVGGADSSGRGGVEAARFYEWGGHDRDGTYAFERERPGWKQPIHKLLVENGVAVVFHGHDHFYAKQELDGVIYQLVPQPGHSRYGGVRTAQEYGYVEGDILPGTGHLKATVSPANVRIDFARSVLSQDEARRGRNTGIAASYTISAASRTTVR
jgi:hypothetical protein